jgi:hypothetical protein
LYQYTAFGLHICSALRLPELTVAGDATPNIVIDAAPLDWRPAAVDADGTCFEITPTEAHLHWEEIGSYRVRNGAEVTIDALPGVDERLVRLPLLGTVLAVLLHQRGHLTLHASVVAIADQAAIFIGDKGQGKSTMAAALYARGHVLAADDMATLDTDPTAPPLVRPGFPQFKLWPATLSSLGDDPEALPRLADGFEKRARLVTQRFADQSLPVGGIFVLRIGSALEIRRLGPQEALIQLVTHTYVARFGNQMLHGAAAAEHLRRCAYVVRTVPVYALERPRSLDLLPAIVQLVEDQIVRGAPALK